MSEPGWQPDPTGRHEYRYWDGARFTDDVADGGATAVDPMTPSPEPPPTAVQPPVPPAPPVPAAVPPAAAPPAAVPPPPSYDDLDDGPSGRSTLLLAVLALLVVGLTAAIIVVVLNTGGSGDDDDAATDDTTTSTSTTAATTTTAPTTTTGGAAPEQIVDEFADAITNGSDGRFDREQARCMARGILDTIGLQRLAEVRAQAQGKADLNPVDLLTEEEQDQAFDAMRACVPGGDLGEAPSSG